jgi:hypothetical protein
VLLYFWLGLCRVPFVREAGLTWEDRLDVRPLLATASGLWLDLTSPFTRYPSLGAVCCIEPSEADFGGRRGVLCVKTRPDYSACRCLAFVRQPLELTLYIARGEGIVGGRVKTADDEILIERVGDASHAR